MARWITVPKPGGGARRIYVPDPQEKRFLRSLLPRLRRLWKLAAARCMRRYGVRMFAYRNAVHGFLPGRSPVTMAIHHVGAAAALSVDIEDFFDSVTEKMVRDTILRLSSHPFPDPLVQTLDHIFRNGVAAQGLPTSPMASNIAFLEADAMLVRFALERRLVYTRYADDLVISTKDPSVRMKDLLPDVRRIVETWGFRVNPRKVRIQTARAGRIVVCGVAVGPDGIHPTRASRRKLRALLHLGKTAPAAGLAAWCRLTMPRLHARRLLYSYHAIDSNSLCHAASRPCSAHCTDAFQALEELRRSTDAFRLATTVHEAIALRNTLTTATRFLQRDPQGQQTPHPCLGTVLRFAARAAIPAESIRHALRAALKRPTGPGAEHIATAALKLVQAVSAGSPEEAAAALSGLSDALRSAG